MSGCKPSTRLLQNYEAIIQEQIKKGIVKNAFPADSMPTHFHYLLHHSVIHKDKEITKVRVVYDNSARVDGQPSLNDHLLIRPKFNQKIFDLLGRFRSYPIALKADIEKAFFMVALKPED